MTRYVLSFLVKFAMLLLAYALYSAIGMHFNGKRPAQAEVARGIGICYAIALLLQLVMPCWGVGAFALRAGEINLVPGKTILQFLSGNIPVNASDMMGAVVDNLLLNCISFIPLGFIPLFSKRITTLFRVIMLSMFLNVLIEFAQYFTARVADIDDVILRLVGTLIGFAIFKAVQRSRADQA